MPYGDCFRGVQLVMEHAVRGDRHCFWCSLERKNCSRFYGGERERVKERERERRRRMKLRAERRKSGNPLLSDLTGNLSRGTRRLNSTPPKHHAAAATAMLLLTYQENAE